MKLLKQYTDQELFDIIQENDNIPMEYLTRICSEMVRRKFLPKCYKCCKETYERDDTYELDDLIKKLESIRDQNEGLLSYPKALYTLAKSIKSLSQ